MKKILKKHASFIYWCNMTNNRIYFRFYNQTFWNFCSHNSLVNLIIHLNANYVFLHVWEKKDYHRKSSRNIEQINNLPPVWTNNASVRKIRVALHRKFFPDSIWFFDLSISPNLLILGIYILFFWLSLLLMLFEKIFWKLMSFTALIQEKKILEK